MLSHQDVHYLVGLLQVVTSPRPLEVELGSMVFDDASETERDVDVTVKYRLNDPSVSALVGLEVKDHSRPLDVTHVEQLTAKMNDMGAITDRAIVSASGFSEPAIRKAVKHGVRCLELQAWDGSDELLPATMTQWKTFHERAVAWDGLQVVFNPSHEPVPGLQDALDANNPLVDETGAPLEQSKDVREFVDMIAKLVSSHYSKSTDFEAFSVGERGFIQMTVDFEERVHISVSEGRLEPLTSAFVQGNLYWLEHHHTVQFRRLVDVTDNRRSIAGCGLAEFSTGELMGITTTNVGVSVIRIPAADRKKAMLRRHRLV